MLYIYMVPALLTLAFLPSPVFGNPLQVAKPCWDNDVEYIDGLGNLLDGQLNKKDSIAECELSCQRYSEQGCLFWSYHKTLQWCSLKSERMNAPRAADNYISGSLGCKVPANFLETTVAKPCWDNDVEYIDSLGISYNLLDGQRNKKDSIAECELSCQRYSEQGCIFWSYHKTLQWCSLKSERVDAPSAVDHYISGMLGCKVPTNFLEISVAYNKNISLKN